jgi:hypothetical protein
VVRGRRRTEGIIILSLTLRRKDAMRWLLVAVMLILAGQFLFYWLLL